MFNLKTLQVEGKNFYGRIIFRQGTDGVWWMWDVPPYLRTVLGHAGWSLEQTKEILKDKKLKFKELEGKE